MSGIIDAVATTGDDGNLPSSKRFQLSIGVTSVGCCELMVAYFYRFLPMSDALINRIGGGRRIHVIPGDAIGPDYCVDETLKALPVRPAVVVLPSETAQVAAAVEAAAAHAVAVIGARRGPDCRVRAFPCPTE